jgi:hypothetical protein
MDAASFAQDADRRVDRTEDALGALGKLVEASRRRTGLTALAVSDSLGLLLAGAGAHQLCEELAAWAPLVGRHADNDTVPSCLDAYEGRTSLRRLAIDGFEVVVSLCGSGAGTSAELDAVSAGCRRILKRI